MTLKVLYIGGTGQISFDCVIASVAAGHDTHVFNRGNSNAGLPDAVTFHTGDVNDPAAYGALAAHGFDTVCQFRTFTPGEMQRDLEVFAGQVGQFLFISTASAYRKPMDHYLVTEAVPLENPFWEYSRLKAECEALLTAQTEMPYTIVRPSHTFRDRLVTGLSEHDLAADRILAGKPVVVPGDGNSLWTITPSADFAPPFVRLLGNERSLGQAFHLTGGAAFAWNQIYRALGRALGCVVSMVHVPTDTLIRYRPDWEGPLLGYKANSVLFDDAKVRGVVGDFGYETDLDRMLEKPVAAYRARRAAGAAVNAELDALLDRIAADQSAIGPDTT